MTSHQRCGLQRTVGRRNRSFRHIHRSRPVRFFGHDKHKPRFTRLRASPEYFYMSGVSRVSNYEIRGEVPQYLEFMLRSTQCEIAHQAYAALDI